MRFRAWLDDGADDVGQGSDQDHAKRQQHAPDPRGNDLRSGAEAESMQDPAREERHAKRVNGPSRRALKLRRDQQDAAVGGFERFLAPRQVVALEQGLDDRRPGGGRANP
mgnify:CR=1 FL=1